MPYKSEKQKRFMQAVAHNPKFAKKVGVSQSVGEKFEAHKASGGNVALTKLHHKLATGKKLKMQRGGTPVVEDPILWSGSTGTRYKRETTDFTEADARALIDAYGWSDPYALPEFASGAFDPYVTQAGGRTQRRDINKPLDYAQQYYDQKYKDTLAAANLSAGEAPISARPAPIQPQDPASLIGTPGGGTQAPAPATGAPTTGAPQPSGTPLDPRLQQMVTEAQERRYLPQRRPLGQAAAPRTGPNVSRTSLPGNNNRLQTLQSTLRSNLEKRKFKEGGAVKGTTQLDKDVAGMLSDLGITDAR